MSFFKKILGFEPNCIKLISATIFTDEDHNYFLIFSKHHPQLKLPEYVRLLLHYYAKILCNFDPLDPNMLISAGILKEAMNKLIMKGIRKDTNILKNANIDDVVKIVSSKPHNIPRKIVATLYFMNTMQRHIVTDIPPNIYTQHAVFSVMVLLQSVLAEIDDECIDILNKALKHMNAAYASGNSFSTIENLASVPTKAYLSAISGNNI
jgi:hypothetical protein